MKLVQVQLLAPVLGMDLIFYTSVAKGLKVEVKKFWGIIHTFVKVTGVKLVGGLFPTNILNRAKLILLNLICLINLSMIYESMNVIF